MEEIKSKKDKKRERERERLGDSESSKKIARIEGTSLAEDCLDDMKSYGLHSAM